MKDIREKKITETSLIGIIANVFLASFKALVGLLASSISIVLDAVNNFSDALSSIITIVGIKLSKKKPTDKHPFGYGRIEYFSAVIIAAIILATGVTSGIESVKKIINPETPDFSWVTATVVGSAIIVKVLLGLFTRARGKKYNSEALRASGVDALFDAIISISTLVGIGIFMIWNINLDGYIGCIIALLILKTGIEILLESVSNIMGNRSDSELTKEIKETVKSIDGVIGAYDLILHNYGPDSAIGSIHVEISSKMTADEIHTLAQHIQSVIVAKYHIFLAVGIYSVNEDRANDYKAIKDIATSFENVLGCHGIFINDEKKIITFDVLINFLVKDRKQLTIDIRKKVNEIYPDYNVAIKFDTNFSD